MFNDVLIKEKMMELVNLVQAMLVEQQDLKTHILDLKEKIKLLGDKVKNSNSQ